MFSHARTKNTKMKEIMKFINQKKGCFITYPKGKAQTMHMHKHMIAKRKGEKRKVAFIHRCNKNVEIHNPKAWETVAYGINICIMQE